MKPALFIISGHLGVGKTTTANLLGKIINSPVVSIDKTIYRIFEEPSNVGKNIPFNEFELKICYNTFALVSEHVLSSGKSIIIDGAFGKKEQRELLISIAKKLNLPHHVLYITCPDEIVKERATKRFSDGKGVGWQAHLDYKKKYEPLDIDHHIIDSSGNVEEQLNHFLMKAIKITARFNIDGKKRDY